MALCGVFAIEYIVRFLVRPQSHAGPPRSMLPELNATGFELFHVMRGTYTKGWCFTATSAEAQTQI